MIEVSDNISNYIKELFGPAYLNKYLEFIYSDPSQYIRLPGDENSVNKIVNDLAAYDISLERVPNLTNSFKVLKGGSSIGKTIQHAVGKYYIQSLSSMIPPLILNPRADDLTLDLCAAPGSKSTQLSESMRNRGTLYLNEVSPNRIKALVFNMDKMLLLNSGVINYKGELLSKIFDNYFDKILVDAPCSALGILQKKGEVSNWWNLNQVSKITDLQLRLLIAAIKMLRPGGEVVYSTCTITLEENEFILDRVLNKYPVEMVDIDLPVKSVEGITNHKQLNFHKDISKAHRIIPWEVDSEGFFVCKLKKTGPTEPVEKMHQKPDNRKFVDSEHKSVEKYVSGFAGIFGIDKEIMSNYKYLQKGNDVYFTDKNWHADNLGLFVRTGIKFGYMDKRDQIIPHTQSVKALERHITGGVIDIDNVNDLSTYLNGGTIKRENTSPGHKGIRYNGMMLGTGVVTGDGIKSQLPRAFRTQQVVFESPKSKLAPSDLRTGVQSPMSNE